MQACAKKIGTLAATVNWRKRQKALGRRVVFTNGCFDILHAGHITILEAARNMGDALVVGLNSDSSVRRLKGPSRPVNPQKDRALVLSALQSVDRVVIFNEDTPSELLSYIRPDILVKGADYKVSEVAGREYAGKVALVRLLKGRSTTRIIGRAACK